MTWIPIKMLTFIGFFFCWNFWSAIKHIDCWICLLYCRNTAIPLHHWFRSTHFQIKNVCRKTKTKNKIISTVSTKYVSICFNYYFNSTCKILQDHMLHIFHHSVERIHKIELQMGKKIFCYNFWFFVLSAMNFIIII